MFQNSQASNLLFSLVAVWTLNFCALLKLPHSVMHDSKFALIFAECEGGLFLSWYLKFFLYDFSCTTFVTFYVVT